MVTRIGSSRKKSKFIMRVPKKEKGKLKISRHLQVLKEGDRVVFKVDPSHHKGQYFIRFHGKSGKILKPRGSAYEVEFSDKNKKKIVVTNPVHLLKVENGAKSN